MRREYDFSKAAKNPFVKQDKQVVTIRLDIGVVEYFKQLSAEVDLPYQTLINACLADCVRAKRHPSIIWEEGSGKPVAAAQ